MDEKKRMPIILVVKYGNPSNKFFSTDTGAGT